MDHIGLHSSFLINVSDLLLKKLLLLINGMFCHCYISNEVIKRELSPTVKDAKGNITEVSDYRSVMQYLCILKVVEIQLLEILFEEVSFNSQQFGFQTGLPTSDACFVLREIIHIYLF